MRPLTISLTMLLGLGCSSAGGPQDIDRPQPSYTWQGKALDATTGEPVVALHLNLKESQEHWALGWAPRLIFYINDDSTFFAEYMVPGVPCDPPTDTTVVLTLEIGDSAGVYGPAVDVRQWHFKCTTSPIPNPTPLPWPTVDSLQVLLEKHSP